jgi:hypothetical protein
MNKFSTSTAALASLAVLLLVALAVPSQAAPFIYVANAGEDTVSKIDVTTNTEVARYATWFNSGSNNLIAAHIGNAWAGPAPSRIAQDTAGNIYVLNRFFSTGTGSTGKTWSNPPHRPVLLKIAPSGAPTSNGSTALPIIDSNNNNDIDPGETTDNRIVWAKPIGQVADNIGVGRAVAVDKTGNLWVGMYSTKQYYKVDPTTGNTIGGPITTGTHTPYGCAVDMNGKLWSADESKSLAEIDTVANTLVAVHNHTNYGTNYSLSVFNDCSSTPPKVKIYLSETTNGKTYIVYDPQTSSFSNSPGTIPQLKSLAIAVDSHGDIVSGEYQTTGRIIKTSPTGSLLWDTNTSGPTVPVADLRGIIIDKNNDVWAVDRQGNRVIKYSGSTGSYIATVPVGNMPYTYGNAPPPTCNSTPTPTPTPTPSPTPTSTPTPTPGGGGCADVSDKEIRCLPNGGYSYTFNVANNSGSAMSQILLTPVGGSTFTLSPQLSTLSSPLQNGQSTTVTTTIANAKPGDKVCFFVSLLSDKAPCCNVQACLTLPRCGEAQNPKGPTKLTRQLRPGRRRP